MKFVAELQPSDSITSEPTRVVTMPNILNDNQIIVFQLI